MNLAQLCGIRLHLEGLRAYWAIFERATGRVLTICSSYSKAAQLLKDRP